MILVARNECEAEWHNESWRRRTPERILGPAVAVLAIPLQEVAQRRRDRNRHAPVRRIDAARRDAPLEHARAVVGTYGGHHEVECARAYVADPHGDVEDVIGP